MLPVRYRVAANDRETADTSTLRLVPLEQPIARFRAGQFTMVYVFGVGEIPLSISGSPLARDTDLIHTVRGVGAVSEALHAIGVGGVVGIRGPYGTGWDVEHTQGSDLLFIAGGIGLAPLRPAVLEALDRRDRYDRVFVLAGARTPEDHIYTGEIESWIARGAVVRRTVDRTSGPGSWPGSVGLVTELLDDITLRPARTTAFVCGPEVMMTHTGLALTDRGIPPERIRLSLERDMKCGIAQCGHCQLGPDLICRDGPVTTLDHAAPLLAVAEL
jgi:NAD(P)H-flavin reductase